jgi:PII-like signaling protein
MLAGRTDAVGFPADLREEVKLTVSVGRHERVGGTPVYEKVVDLLHHRGIAGASVLLGVDGTAEGIRQRARFFGANAHS